MISSEAVVVDLGSHLTIADVERVQQQLEGLLAGGHNFALDAAQLEKIDTAGLQLLCSLKKTLQNAESELNWKEASPTFIKSAYLMGVNHFLQLV